MQANWSLLLNVLLLIGVIVAISRTMKTRRHNVKVANYRPSVDASDNKSMDDIIAVRKVSPGSVDEIAAVASKAPQSTPGSVAFPASKQPSVSQSFKQEPMPPAPSEQTLPPQETASSIMLFLLAKDNRQLAGYDLLQTLLAAGLRFGEGQLFHRHQSTSGQGPIMCSLAAATPTGTFDLQKIGSFHVHGLCLFMQISGNPTIDEERFSIMLDTAKHLSEELDTYLLDEQRKPLSEEGIQRYYRTLSITQGVA